MRQILIIGQEGQLGSTFHQLSANIPWAQWTFTTEKILDLTSQKTIRNFFSDKKFDFIVNCAAYTAVDKAESERETAFRLNAEALGYIGVEAARMGAKIIHISTDYVFGGMHNRPLKPDHPTDPESVYGQSKLKGEEILLKNNSQSMVIRTSWLYSLHGKNFFKTMLNLGQERDTLNVVFDQIGTPTLADDLADAILSIINKTVQGETKFVPGVYHYSNEGVCSWFDFAIAIFEETGINCRTIPVESDQFPTPAPRPFYSVMDKSLIKNTFRIEIPHWQKSLKKCIAQHQANDKSH